MSLSAVMMHCLRIPFLGFALLAGLAVSCSEDETELITQLCSTPCECDTTTACDGEACSCDPECGRCLPPCAMGCECDLTTACDGDCSCDPECNVCLVEKPAGQDAGVGEDGGEVIIEGQFGAPYVESLESNVYNLLDGSSILFTARVRDSDGADDIVEGYIRTADGLARVVSFARQSADQLTATYTAELTWDALYAAEPFTLEKSRRAIRIEAVFVDASGHEGSRFGSLEAQCSFGEWGQVCGGRCVSLYGDRNHCGECGNQCDAGDSCTATNCGSPTGWSACLPETRAASCDAFCQSEGLVCSNSCGVLSGTRRIDDLGGQGYFNDTCTQSPHTSYDPNQLDFKQTPAVCSTSFSSWPAASQLTHFRCCCRSS